MDGSTIGYGSGPRAMKLKRANLLLTSTDQLALDATAAKIIGLTPKKIAYLQLGKKAGLGEIQPEKISTIFSNGINSLPNFHLKQTDNTASKGQKFIYHHCPSWLEKMMLQTIIAPWSYLASRIYYDVYWYNLIGKKRLNRFLASDWGKLFYQYQHYQI